MNDLVDADYDVSKITQTTIVLPSRGEPLSILREVILSTMSLHLWPGKLDVRRNLRLIVIDDVRRSEVKLLLGLCYRFAALFCNNRKVRARLHNHCHPQPPISTCSEHGQTCANSLLDTCPLRQWVSCCVNFL
jgi:hypothetical protein